MKSHKTILYSLILCSLAFTQCSKDALKEDPRSIILADNLFRDKAGFEAGLNGLYDEVRRSRSSVNYGAAGQVMLTPCFIGVDNAYANWRDAYEDVFNNWGANNNAAQLPFELTFRWLYETINAANTIIARAENPDIDWTETEKNTVVAEARFIRGWCYRHLTYLWGDVPLTLEESSGVTIKTDWERTAVATVRKAMEDDWLFAEQHLPETSSNPGKVVKAVAQHYLSELYLVLNRPEDARDYALKVINNPIYKLITARYGKKASQPGTPFTDMFIDGNSNKAEGNTEALWVLQNELNVIGGEGSNIMRRYWVNRYYSLQVGGKNPIMISEENGGRGIGRWGPTKFALSLYEPGADDRGSHFAWRLFYRINTTNPNNIPAGYQLGDTIFIDTTSAEKLSNPNWPNTTKWDYVSPIDVNVDRQYNDQILVRLGETYLLLAEAYLKTSEPQLAADAINELRTRAHASPIDAGDVTIDFILDERSRELFSEEERRYTLLRTGKWLERTRAHNPFAKVSVADRDTLLPIPQAVIDANRTSPMGQNPGY